VFQEALEEGAVPAGAVRAASEDRDGEDGPSSPGGSDVGPGERPLVDILATLYVEKDSQKGILIGAGGQMLKRIGERARREIEVLLGARVFLKLWVKVRPKWRQSKEELRRLGYLQP
jgi:hypothetical protein